MCDIYEARCPVCKKKIEMHLADYATGRDEVTVLCGVCFEEDAGWINTRLWRGDNGQLCVVIPLTNNAQDHELGNHPNASDPYYWDRETGNWRRP